MHLQLRQKISSATSAIKSVFGQEENRQDSVSLMIAYACKCNFPFDWVPYFINCLIGRQVRETTGANDKSERAFP